MKSEYSKHLLLQKKENAKLQREVNQYMKDITELQKDIYFLMGKINNMERGIGIKQKGYAQYDDNLIIGTEEARFIIKIEKI